MEPGTIVLDRYAVEALAGRGGMGSVYRARDRDGQLVAVKRLDAAGPEQASRFRREIDILGKLDHPAIVRYLDSGVTDDGKLCLVMEWLEGEDLHDRLARESLDLDDALQIIERVADALGHAHSRGVVHRDVKPRNIFLPGCDIEATTLLDFGLARWSRASQILTLSGAAFGTPAYMAPEQVRGGRDVDARADVFALGGVLYECITGESAFAAHELMAVFYKILMEDPPAMDELMLGVPPQVGALVSHLLCKNPDDRPPNGRAAAALLAQARAGLGGVPVPKRSQASESQPTATLTGAEQRVVTMLAAKLAGPSASEHGLDTLDPTANSVFDAKTALGSAETARSLADERAALEARLGELGARYELIDGEALIACLEPDQTGTVTSPVDRAVQMARVALSIRAGLPQAPIAIATGRAETRGARIVGEAIERAVALLDHTQGPSGPLAIRDVHVDELTATLIETRFQVETGAGDRLCIIGEWGANPLQRETGPQTPFVGRSRELAMLEAAWNACVDDGASQLVLLTGAPGLGKTRLCSEFLARLKARGEPLELWLAHGDPMRANSALHLMASALRHGAELRPEQDRAQQMQALQRRVGSCLSADERARVCAFLGELVGLGASSDVSPQLRAARDNPKLMGDQIRRACLDILDVVTAARPVLFVLEDLHWGDRATMALLAHALRQLRERPLMVLAVGRDELRGRFSDLWADAALTELRLAGLTRRATERLAREFLGADSDSEQVSAYVDRADGNPFYLEQLVRSAGVNHGELPASVMAMVHARLSELAPQARLILRAASVFGAVFWRDGVAALVGGSLALDGQLEAVLDELADGALIEAQPASRFGDQPAYRFHHALIREGAYSMLTEDDRKLGHRLAGEWLSQTGEPDARLLAQHFDFGGELARAQPLYVRAACDALSRSDLDAALALAERGIACGAAGADLGRLYRVQMEERIWRGQVTEIIRLSEQALALLPRGQDEWYEAAGERALALGIGGHDQLLDALVDELHSVHGTGSEHLVAKSKAAAICFKRGKSDRAHALLAEVEGAVLRLARPDLMLMANLHLVRATQSDTLLGDVETQLRELERCLRCFEGAGDLRNASLHRVNVSYTWLSLGVLDAAEVELTQAIRDAEKLDASLTIQFARKHLARLHMYRSTSVSAELVTELGELATQWGQRGDAIDAEPYLLLATAHLRADDSEQALAAVQAALVHATESSPQRPWALALWAQIHLAQGTVEQALAHATEARACLEVAHGTESGEALVRLVHAEALAASGAGDQAQRAIAEARDALLARADRIGRADWRAAFLGNIPDHARTLALARAWLKSE